jgi:hypothetical protein
MVCSLAELSPFGYTALAPGEIRLLVPDMTGDNDGLSWTMQHIALDSEPRFEALSYTWGSQIDTYPISCNRRLLRIHHNLHNALPYLAQRNEDSAETLPLWIDAVCINQADDNEKSIQINLMNLIYKQASKVWAWLGLAEEQSKLSLLMSLLPTIVAYNKQITAFNHVSEPERPAELRQIDITYRTAILHLFRNQWFYRVWVIQEASLTSNITFLCGHHEIEFTALQDAIQTQVFNRWVWYDAAGSVVKAPYMSVDVEALTQIRTFFRSQLVDESQPTVVWRSLRLILLMAPNFDCFSPRDRVLGMMGLLKEMDHNVPDFTDAVSIPELYTSFSRYVLSKSTRDPHWWRYLNLSFNLRRTEGLPSWVPDLHYQRAPYICQPQSIREFQPSDAIRFKASTSRNTVVMGDRPDEIIFRGMIVDSIVLVHPPPPTFHYLYDAAEDPPTNHEEDVGSKVTQFADLSAWEKQVAGKALAEQPGENGSDSSNQADSIRVSRDTYWRTLMGGNTSNAKSTYTTLTQDTWTSFLTALHQLATAQTKVYQYAPNPPFPNYLTPITSPHQTN